MKGNNASWKLIEVDCQPIVIVYLALLPINPATNKISSAKIQRWWAVSAYIFCITLWEGGEWNGMELFAWTLALIAWRRTFPGIPRNLPGPGYRRYLDIIQAFERPKAGWFVN